MLTFRLTYKRAIRDSHLLHFGFVLPDDLQPLIHLHLLPHAPDTLHPLRLHFVGGEPLARQYV